MGQRDTDRQGRPGSLGICMWSHVSMVGCLVLGVALTCTMPEEREASRDSMRARRKKGKEEGRKGRVKGSSQGGGNAQPKWENLYESLKREEKAMAKAGVCKKKSYFSRRARVRTKRKEER
jgi:hypothetical protein